MAEPHSLRVFLLRWAELAVVLAGACAALWVVGAPSMRFGWLSIILSLAILGAAAVLAFAAVRRAMRHDDAQLGQVFVEERRLLYIGPRGNVQVPLDAVQRIDLLKTRGGSAVLFEIEGGIPASIPLNAKGSDALEAALFTMPGLSASGLDKAVAANKPIVTIWSRPAPRVGH